MEFEMFNENKKDWNYLDVEEIWGINFFWAKGLKFSEEDLKKVTEQVMHQVDQRQQPKLLKVHGGVIGISS